MNKTRPPVVLTIAGTDPSGGAGIQADLKTFTALGVYGASAVTSLVAQNTHGVRGVRPVAPGFVAEQIDAVREDIPLDAVKTGMLGETPLVELVAGRIASGTLGFAVVDPVMVASSGDRLLEPAAVSAMRELLLPAADLLTPNLPEAAILLGEGAETATDAAQMHGQALALLEAGPGAVLLKGGHMAGSDFVLDVLALRGEDGRARTVPFEGTRVRTTSTHGTGCTLSAAIAAEYARRLRAGRAAGDQLLIQAVAAGREFLRRALTSAASWHLPLDPRGAHGPVDHLVDLRERTRV